VHTVAHAALGAAVRDGLIATNPADKAVPPSAREATSPEMRAWDDVQLRRFLDWSKDSGDEMRVAWSLLALTGMRRGEALALRWGDVDFDGATIAVRRAVTLVKTKGTGEQLVVGTRNPAKHG
jgi:integrase